MPLFRENQILTIEDQVMLENCKFMYCLNEKTKCPVPLINLFKVCKNMYNTRFSSLNIRAHKGVKFNSSYLCKSVLDWQKLGIDLKLSKSKYALTKKLKCNLISKY